MYRSFRELARERYDVLVVGGGIHGVWTARAAASAGLKVALAEAVDLASGTTSRSTMLAHGGLRYLAQFDIGLVREALRERGELTRKAPQLVQPLPFLLPFYEGAPYPKWQLKTGIRAYTWLARGSGYPRHHFLSREKVLELEPGLRRTGLKGGALYYDGQILMPERLTTLVARDAADRGATITNHAKVTELTGTSKVTGAVVEDRFTGEQAEITAHAVLNTTGPFLDHFLTDVGAPDDMLRLTKGVHLITPRFTDHAIVINATDGRTFFTLPWYDYQLVGTTDTDYTDDPRQVHATAEDVSYLQDSTLEFFPSAPAEQVHFTYAGLRNLLNVEGVDPSQITRRPEIRDHTQDGFEGLYSLAGGKLTTARATAFELLEAAQPHLPRPLSEMEPGAPLPGGAVHLGRALNQALTVTQKAGLDDAVAERLVRLYGAEWANVAGAGLEALTADQRLLTGEVVHAAEKELAQTVEDVVRRRTLAWVSQDQAIDAAPAIAELLAESGVPEAQAMESQQGWRETVALHERWRSGER